MVKIAIYGTTASIEHYQWTCGNMVIEKYLNALRDPLGPSGADPYPDLTLAQEIVQRLGAKITFVDEVEHLPEGTVI